MDNTFNKEEFCCENLVRIADDANRKKAEEIVNSAMEHIKDACFKAAANGDYSVSLLRVDECYKQIYSSSGKVYEDVMKLLREKLEAKGLKMNLVQADMYSAETIQIGFKKDN